MKKKIAVLISILRNICKTAFMPMLARYSEKSKILFKEVNTPLLAAVGYNNVENILSFGSSIIKIVAALIFTLFRYEHVP